MTPDAQDEPSLHSVYLNPGQLHVASEPTVVGTLLGSCVAVTLFHPATRMGAVCHGLLPNCTCGARCVSQCTDCFKFVDCSILHMLNAFEGRGIPRVEIRGKIFGGADMFETHQPQATIGHQNVAIARKVMRAEKLKIVATDVGGIRGRKIFFYSHTGEVLLKRLHKSRELYPEGIGLEPEGVNPGDWTPVAASRPG